MVERKSSFLNFFNRPKHPPYFNGAVKGDAIPKYGGIDEKNRSYIEKMLDQRPTAYGYHTGFDVNGVKSRAGDNAMFNKVGRSQTVKQMINHNYQKQVYSKNNRPSHYRSSASLTRESYLEDSKNYDELFTPSNVNHNNYSDYTRKLLLLTSREPEGTNKLKKSKSFKEVYNNPETELEKNSNTFKRYVKSLKRRLTKSKKSDFQLTQKPQQKQISSPFIKEKSEDKDVQSSSFIDSGIHVSKNSPPQLTSNRVSRKDEFYKYDSDLKKSYGRLTRNDCGVSRKFQFKCDFEKVAPSPPKDKIDSGVETRENSKEKKLFSTSESEEQEEYVKRANTVQLVSNPYRTRITKRAESKNRSLSPRRKARLDKEDKDRKFGSSINIWQQQDRINEKIKKETEHHVIKTQKQQLNLLMNKTTKWVMTQNFEKYRGGEHGARHEDQVWTDG